jgi:hypothetical protein
MATVSGRHIVDDNAATTARADTRPGSATADRGVPA